MRNLVIAIDGLSSTGKSTVSRAIAQKLGIIYLDTGALYRGVAFYAMHHCYHNDGSINFEKLFQELPKINLTFKNESGEMILYLNGENINNCIRTQEISNEVSNVAKQKEIRDFLLEIQLNIAKKGSVIMDGRDIGTVILPNADYKFFLTASLDQRAKRRFIELKQMGMEANFEEVKHNLIIRDKIDSNRKIAPLKKAKDAILVDNTNMDKEETIAFILSKIKEFNKYL